MSTADPSTPHLPTAVDPLHSLVASTINASISALQGLAFWATIPLPLAILGSLVTGLVSSMPHLVGALVVLNILCAAVGHRHSPQI